MVSAGSFCCNSVWWSSYQRRVHIGIQLRPMIEAFILSLRRMCHFSPHFHGARLVQRVQILPEGISFFSRPAISDISGLDDLVDVVREAITPSSTDESIRNTDQI